MLLLVNNEQVEYDNYGRIITLLGKSFVWNDDGTLKSVSLNGETNEDDQETEEVNEYVYNDKGIRYLKNLSNGKTIRFVLDGSKILAEKHIGEFDIYYIYNSTNELIGFSYNNQNYFYEKNICGDIIRIHNQNGQIVGEYNYDAFGNIVILTDVNGIATLNPFRYRGYYYDVETGLYYLNARYYNPNIGRFISPDDASYIDPNNVNGLNIYAYCNNDPINYCDATGHFAITLATLLIGGLIAGAIGAGIGLGTAVYKDVKKDGIWFNGDWTDYLGGILGGFVAGFGVGVCTVLGAGVGVAALGGTTATLFTSTGLTLSLGSALGIGSGVAFATGMAGYAVRNGISRSEDFKVQNMFIEGGFNAVSGTLSVLAGYLGGMAGVHNTVFTKLLSQKGDFWLRLIIENVFTGGFKMINALIKSLI